MKIKKHLITVGVGLGIIAIALPVSLRNINQNVAKADDTRDFASVISFKQANFIYEYIGDYFVDFQLSERVFTRTGYLNDHITEFLDKNNQPINLGEGIIINGQTFKYWIDYTASDLTYPRNEGVHVWPLDVGGQLSPVAIEVSASTLSFKFNLEYFPMDSIEITFKAGVFEGYYNGVAFTLSEDLTFRSTLNEDSSASFNKRVKFTKEVNEYAINAKIDSQADSGELTAPGGGKYHRFLLWTNIPFSADYMDGAFAADHYRYMFDNILLNGRSLTSYNAWARGNSKDFTSLSNPVTQNPAYETGHPTGSVNTVFDLAMYIQMAMDQPKYVFDIKVPNQLRVDCDLTTVEFSIREGSAWQTLNGNGEAIVGRNNPSAFNAPIGEALDLLDDYSLRLPQYRQADREELAMAIDSARTIVINAFTLDVIESSLENVANAFASKKTDEELTKQEHVDNVVELIDMIPATITYSNECYQYIKNAMEAYIALTSEEKEMVPQESINKMYEAYASYNALDLLNYKYLAKQEINLKVHPIMYFEEERTQIEALMNAAIALIDSANFKEQIDEAVNNLFVDIKPFKDAKTIANEELDAIDVSDCNESQKAKISEIITAGKKSIAQCESAEEVKVLLDRIKEMIRAIKENTNTDVEPGTNVIITKGPNVGVIIAIAVGTFVAGAGIAALVMFLVFKKKRA